MSFPVSDAKASLFGLALLLKNTVSVAMMSCEFLTYRDPPLPPAEDPSHTDSGILQSTGRVLFEGAVTEIDTTGFFNIHCSAIGLGKISCECRFFSENPRALDEERSATVHCLVVCEANGTKPTSRIHRVCTG